MKTVRIQDGIVREIIPVEATPTELWYGTVFASQCVEAPDEVDQHWLYDAETGIFTPPPEPEPMEPEPTPEEQNARLRAQVAMLQEQQTFLENCLLEMADEVYA